MQSLTMPDSSPTIRLMRLIWLALASPAFSRARDNRLSVTLYSCILSFASRVLELQVHYYHYRIVSWAGQIAIILVVKYQNIGSGCRCLINTTLPISLPSPASNFSNLPAKTGWRG